MYVCIFLVLSHNLRRISAGSENLRALTIESLQSVVETVLNTMKAESRSRLGSIAVSTVIGSRPSTDAYSDRILAASRNGHIDSLQPSTCRAYLSGNKKEDEEEDEEDYDDENLDVEESYSNSSDDKENNEYKNEDDGRKMVFVAHADEDQVKSFQTKYSCLKPKHKYSRHVNAYTTM